MNPHMHVFEGDLYDVRSKEPIRKGYIGHRRVINGTLDLRATLRAGRYTWPGVYPVYFACRDGENLCYDCVRSEYRLISAAIKANENNGWLVDGCDINYESDIQCAQCGRQIESAYGHADDDEHDDEDTPC